MCQTNLNEFKRIDDLLEIYYKDNGILNYRDKNGNGQFLRYVKDEELNDPELPIYKELNDNCDPNQSSYSWMAHSSKIPFPIPKQINIPKNQLDSFTFYIIQYCYKHNTSPTLRDIKQQIVPKIKGASISISNSPSTDSLVIALLSNNNGQRVVTPSQSECKSMHERESEGTMSHNEQCNIIRKCKTEFITKFAARAHLNIYTPKELTSKLRDIIAEYFEHDLILYYYMDITTGLQMNDHQVNIFEIYIDNKLCKLGIINYDLHYKYSKQTIIYGIFIPNDYKDKIKSDDKWQWQLIDYMTNKEIQEKYDIKFDELPKSSRNREKFRKQLREKLIINECLIDDTKWFEIEQIKSLKRNIKMAKVTIMLSKDLWIQECKKSFKNIQLPLIPIVVNKNNNHWIEWIKIIFIESQNVYVGISMKLSDNKWNVTSICLDPGDINNKHKLVGIETNNKYIQQLKNFKTSITEIKFTDNDNNNEEEKKIIVLKQQIKSQQDSIIRLKETLLRVKNKGQRQIKYKQQNNIAITSTISQQKELIENLMDCDDQIQEQEQEEEDFLSQIVDDVIKSYHVFDFRLLPIGAKRNIYIDKQFTKLWINRITPRFNNNEMFYYWLDYTTSMQMVQGLCKQYFDKINNKFIIAIINYELKDIDGNILYGIITCDEYKLKKQEKYPFRLQELIKKQEIKQKYGINANDLPKRSRKHKNFIKQLILKRKIGKQDINAINWSNLKLFKSQTVGNYGNNNNYNNINNDNNRNCVVIRQNVMKEYVNIAVERVNKNKNENKNLIPILVVDKDRNNYGIEWVLIVNIIHKNCDIGISFKYHENKNLFVAKSIYLDYYELEIKHKLIGLKSEYYLKNVDVFSLNKFKFKSNKHSIQQQADNDDDDNGCIDNGHLLQIEMKKLEQMVKNEKARNQILQQQYIMQQQQYNVQLQQARQQQQLQQQINMNAMIYYQSSYQYPMNNNYNP